MLSKDTQAVIWANAYTAALLSPYVRAWEYEWFANWVLKEALNWFTGSTVCTWPK